MGDGCDGVCCTDACQGSSVVVRVRRELCCSVAVVVWGWRCCVSAFDEEGIIEEEFDATGLNVV